MREREKRISEVMKRVGMSPKNRFPGQLVAGCMPFSPKKNSLSFFSFFPSEGQLTPHAIDPFHTFKQDAGMDCLVI